VQQVRDWSGGGSWLQLLEEVQTRRCIGDNGFSVFCLSTSEFQITGHDGHKAASTLAVYRYSRHTMRRAAAVGLLQSGQ